MSNLYQLPSKPVREWQAMKTVLVEQLQALGHSEEAIEHVLQRFRPAYLELLENPGETIATDDPEAAVRSVNAFFSRVTTGLMMHIANLAIENHELRKGILREG